MNYFKNIEDYKLTLVNENERSGRQYTFYFKTPEIKKEIEKLVSLSKDRLDISQIISDIKSRKDLYSKLDYTILNVDHAVDIVAYSIKNNILTLPLIDRVYPPYGLALPGGFIDEGETRYEAAKRELEEELNVHCDPIHCEDMDIIELSIYFQKAKKTIYNEINKNRKDLEKYIIGKKPIKLSEEGVRWMELNLYRKRYMKDLYLYKRVMQDRQCCQKMLASCYLFLATLP